MKNIIRIFIISALFFNFSLTGCKSQTKDSTIIKPKIAIKVNKQYDSNGNVISYDSTSSYTYSSHGDSLLFDNKIFFNDDNFNRNLLFNDSLFDNSFNHPFFGMILITSSTLVFLMIN